MVSVSIKPHQSLIISLFCCFSFAITAQYNPEVYQAQKALKELGYNPGKLDGYWGKSTESAVKRFQKRVGLPVTGKLDDQTKARLEIISSSRSLRPQQKIKERRIALIIGNGNYEHSPLRNPVNDATAIAEIAKVCGFEVHLGLNMNQKEMIDTINKFGMEMRPQAVLLFYYAGHGMQVNGENYLIPIGADIYHEDDVEVESVTINRILAKMASITNALNIIILDACRDNPFSRGFRSKQNGLAYMNAPTGTIIAYSTAPGSIARDGRSEHSIYTQSLIEHLLVPNMKIEDMFKSVRRNVAEKTNNKQIPWETSSLMGDFYFTTSKILPHSKGRFSINDLTKEADEYNETRGAWKNYNNEMKRSYADVQKYLERDVPKEKKYKH